ncbi:hypothetical protein BC829DRAFT_378674 [Chytridium lagenaria]|nr:hypothetical protein BC829DRAFT_378674 [Chytridium lagenaria]
MATGPLPPPQTLSPPLSALTTTPHLERRHQLSITSTLNVPTTPSMLVVVNGTPLSSSSQMTSGHPSKIVQRTSSPPPTIPSPSIVQGGGWVSFIPMNLPRSDVQWVPSSPPPSVSLPPTNPSTLPPRRPLPQKLRRSLKQLRILRGRLVGMLRKLQRVCNRSQRVGRGFSRMLPRL